MSQLADTSANNTPPLILGGDPGTEHEEGQGGSGHGEGWRERKEEEKIKERKTSSTFKA